jgi:hypothetical protein
MAEGYRDRQGASLQGGRGERERQPDARQPGLRAVGIAARRVAAPVVARGGGGVLARLKAEWPTVVGAEFAATAWPEALGRDGALKLRVDPGAALDLQHRAPLVIERINLFFGRSAVARLVLVQGRPPVAPLRRPMPAARLTGAEQATLAAQLSDIADSALRDALEQLGTLVLGRSRAGE